MGYYWFHRGAHELGWMWASHTVHHSSEQYNLTTALRQNLVDGIGGVLVYLPAALVVPLPLAMAHRTFNVLMQFYLHTRVVGRLGALEWVLNTPSHHRVHHGRNPRAIDKNFGGVLIVWDRLFGTFHDEAWGEPIVYGVVPPIRNFSPLWANFVEWKGLCDKMMRAPGISNKASMLWRGPGWRYSAKEQRCKHIAVPPLGHVANPIGVYDPPLPHPALLAYALLHLGLALGVYFLHPRAWVGAVAAGSACAFGLTLHVVNGLIEGDPWSPYIEAVRCALAVFLLWDVEWSTVVPLDTMRVWGSGFYLACVAIMFCLIAMQPELRKAAWGKWCAMHADVSAYVLPLAQLASHTCKRSHSRNSPDKEQ